MLCAHPAQKSAFSAEQSIDQLETAHWEGSPEESSIEVCYKHQPFLSNNSTRYVRLLPGRPTDVIRCQLLEGLIPTCIEDVTTPYMALSYTWVHGSRHAIECDNRRMMVTDNLWLALRRLRRRQEATMLWIDAICIDQQDESETAKQINRMREIYANASRVIVFLGEPEAEGIEDTEIRYIFRLLFDLARHLPSERQAMIEPIDEALLQLLGFPGRHDAAWSAITAFFQRPWFRRVWILQEVCQAIDRHAVTMLCGSSKCRFEFFALAVDYVSWRQVDKLTGVNVQPMLRVLAVVRQHWLHSIQPRRDHTDERVLVMLCRSRDSLSTDPRDKIFGTLGLMKGPCPQCTPRLSYLDAALARYPINMRTLYVSVAEAHIKCHARLDMLSAVESPCSRNGTLPSWVPDWSVQNSVMPFYLMDAFGSWYADGSVGDVGRRRGIPPRSSAINFDERKQMLIARGIFVDSCAMITEPLPTKPDSFNKDDEERSLRVVMNSWLKMCQAYATAYELCDRDGTAFASTLIARSSLKNEEDTLAFLSRDRWVRDQYWLHRKYPHVALSDRYPPYMTLYQQATYGRWFFITAKGRMGLCNSGVKAGDRIVLLDGGRSPYLVSCHRTENSWTFLSECYIHGLMEGQGAVDDKTRWRRFQFA